MDYLHNVLNVTNNMKILYPDLKNKTIVITGGLGFLASQFIKAFQQNSCNIIIIDNKNSNKKNYYKCDITNEKNIEEVKSIIKKNYKTIDILINNAANNYGPGAKSKKLMLENFDEKIWDADLNVGLKGAMLCTKIFGREMSKQKNGGNIINISSDLGIISPDNRIYAKNSIKPVTYSVVKHGIIGLSKYTATYWPKKVRCNALAFGGMANNQDKKFVNKLKKLIPLNRMAKKNEYNGSILFLASEASSYINGSTIVVDGGRTIL
jgi:NAD(P)-dependent dehydrogenase (short-subunit alcohol dehydrogenase family)